MRPAALASLALVLGCASPAPRRPAAPPSDPARAFQEVATARDLMLAQNYDEAVLGLEQAVAIHPGLKELAPGETLRRLSGLLSDVGWSNGYRRASLSRTSGEAGQTAHEAIVAYAEGRDLQAVLLASAAMGADPGTEVLRVLFNSLATRTGIRPGPDEALPRKALVQLKLQRAEEAYFAKRFGEAARLCQDALWLDSRSVLAWTRLGSARLASGEADKAREAYAKVLDLDPENADVRQIMGSRGWVGGKAAPEEAQRRTAINTQ